MILRWGYVPFVFENESICLDNLSSLDPDLVISGCKSSHNAIHVITSLKMIRHSLPVLILADDNIVQDYIDTNGFTGVLVFRRNASPIEFKSAVLKAIKPATDERGDYARPLIIGNSPEMKNIKKLIPRLHQFREAVLIEGEPGTGKELFARSIHGYSEKSDNQFIKVNATKLPYQLLDREIFGYQNSEVADFPRHKNGVFAGADRGTLFIKEVSQIPKFLQAKIAALIEAGACRVNSFGESHKNTVDIRFVASTNMDLLVLVKKGLFLEELYYRLNVLRVKIPPLRNRIEDIPSLTDFFSCKHCYEFNKSIGQISSATKSALCEHFWPGNVRELETVVKQLILCGNDEHVVKNLIRTDAQYHMPEGEKHHNIVDHSISFADVKPYVEKSNIYSLKKVRRKYMLAIEQRLIGKALEVAKGNRRKAAELLEISYKSLMNKMKSLNIDNSLG
jgi:two-component system, NtrC family, response regulator AtoC